MNNLFPPLSKLLPTFASALLVILSGCGLTADAPATAPVTGPVEAFMISAEPGQSAQLDDPVFGTDVRVSLEGTFTSAKGENCRRATVLADGKKAEVVVTCSDAAGQWTLAPRVWGEGGI
ncbi:MAG: hypothetical protein LBN28_00485 [Desulfovibrio sp.]|nr:hypothetical protein [Desulfovibrio sp.]